MIVGEETSSPTSMSGAIMQNGILPLALYRFIQDATAVSSLRLDLTQISFPCN